MQFWRAWFTCTVFLNGRRSCSALMVVTLIVSAVESARNDGPRARRGGTPRATVLRSAPQVQHIRLAAGDEPGVRQENVQVVGPKQNAALHPRRVTVCLMMPSGFGLAANSRGCGYRPLVPVTLTRRPFEFASQYREDLVGNVQLPGLVFGGDFPTLRRMMKLHTDPRLAWRVRDHLRA